MRRTLAVGVLGGITLLGTVPAEAQRPPLRLTASPARVQVGEAVTFTVEVEPRVLDERAAVARRQSTFEYVVMFGDGAEQRVTGRRVVHRYARAGAFRATVRMEQNRDPVAMSAPVTISVTPRAPPVTVRLTADRTSVTEGERVVLTAEVDAPAARLERSAMTVYVFTFGDGEEQRVRARRTAHVYTRPGTYRATVRVMMNGETVAESRPIRIAVDARPRPPPTVQLSADRTTATTGERVTFAARVDPPLGRLGEVRYRFTFGDRNQIVSRTPGVTWAYDRAGTFSATVHLLVDGETVARSRPVTVAVAATAPARPSVRLMVSPQDVTEGDRVTFTAAVDPPAAAGAYEYVFDTGEGGQQRGRSARIAHAYERPGSFTATVVLLQQGEPVARSRPVTVAVSPLPVPSDPPPVDPSPTDLTPTDPPPDVTDPPDSPPADQTPADPLPSDEAARVQLSATHEAALVGEAVTFVATASEGDAYVFVVDGQERDPSSASTLTQTFTEAGEVTVSVRLLRSGQVVAESEPVVVTVAAPAPGVVDLRVTPERPRSGDAVSFQVSGVPAASGAEVRFHFGDGAVSGWSETGEIQHTYAAAGAYDARVDVRGLPGTTGVVSSEVVRVRVEAAPPAASAPPWVWGGLVGLALLVGAFAGYALRRSRRAEPVPAPLIGLKPRHDGGATRLAADRPPVIEWEVRLRPVHDRGRHHVGTPAAVRP